MNVLYGKRHRFARVVLAGSFEVSIELPLAHLPRRDAGRAGDPSDGARETA